VFVPLDVLTAQLDGDAIVGTVVNNSGVGVSDFEPVSVACFAGSQITAVQVTIADSDFDGVQPGESAPFATTIPIDPTTCESFAVYAVAIPG
jgi:hypothetical protein